jgi:3-oxoacyl-[acyl-carrier protein] reductase
MTKHAGAHFLKRKQGTIINISSVSGMMGNAGQANYAAAKAGLIGLTKTAAKELAARGITCNAIAPGFITTDMTEQLSDKQKETVVGAIPLKRMGQPQDIAHLAVFLASPLAAYITGEVIKVDGGIYI